MKTVLVFNEYFKLPAEPVGNIAINIGASLCWPTGRICHYQLITLQDEAFLLFFNSSISHSQYNQ